MTVVTHLALFVPIASAVLVNYSVALAQVSPQVSSFRMSHEPERPHTEPDHSAPVPTPSVSEQIPHEHGHRTLELPPNAAVPTVDVIIHPDSVQGWNLELQVTNFTFAPERVNQSSVSSEGHAHLFIDDEKVARLYGNWYHLAPLPPGEYAVSIVLNTNMHEDLVHNGQVIRDVEILQVPSSP